MKTEESIDDDEEDTGTVKRKGKKSDWEPPTGSWEREVNVIESIEEHVDEKTGEMKRWAYVIWNNGKQTKHELRTMNGKAPQKVSHSCKCPNGC